MMTPIHIDFAPSSWQRTVHRSAALAWIAAAIGLTALVSASLTWRDIEQRDIALAAEIGALQALMSERAAASVARTATALTTAQLENLRSAGSSAVADLNRPWAQMFDAMEQAGARPVSLLELEPDPKTQRIKGVAEARNSGAMVDYIARLRQLFGAARLTRHEINAADPAQPIRFEFEVTWQVQR